MTLWESVSPLFGEEDSGDFVEQDKEKMDRERMRESVVILLNFIFISPTWGLGCTIKTNGFYQREVGPAKACGGHKGADVNKDTGIC